MQTCIIQNEIETKPNKTNGNKQNETKNRNTVAMCLMSNYNENKVWGISKYMCCKLCILIYFVCCIFWSPSYIISLLSFRNFYINTCKDVTGLDYSGILGFFIFHESMVFTVIGVT